MAGLILGRTSRRIQTLAMVEAAKVAVILSLLPVLLFSVRPLNGVYGQMMRMSPRKQLTEEIVNPPSAISWCLYRRAPGPCRACRA
eukprot:symbB.v1.2.020916.t3/scaffold1785.1/size101431/4